MADKDIENLIQTRLKTRSFAHIKATYDFKQPNMILGLERELKTKIRDFTCITLDVIRKSEVDAFIFANKQVELLRSLINFELSFSMITWQFGRPRALNRIEPARYIFVFDENRRYLGNWGNVGEFRYELVKLQKNQLASIEKSVKDFGKLNNNKLKARLVDCLALYGNALDQIERGYVFLSLWQILELISLQDIERNFGKVRSRVAAIFKNSQIISDVLEVLFYKRNKLVHEGRISDFSLQDVNQIKGITEGCIDFLWSHVNKFENVEKLGEFYENIRFSNKKLDDKIEVLDYIKKVRK